MIYKIVLDDTNIYNTEKALTLLSPHLQTALNESGSLEFTMPPNHVFYDSVNLFKSTVEVYEDDELLWFGRPVESTIDFYKQKTIYCEGGLSYFNDSIQRPRTFDTTMVHTFFRYLISEHNSQVDPEQQFTIGTITVDNKSIYRQLDYNTTWDAITKMCLNAEGGYIIIRRENHKNYIDWYKEVPYSCNQTIEFGLNLLDISSTYDMSDICTQVLPVGPELKDSDGKNTGVKMTISSVNSGSDYVASEEGIAAFGKITKVLQVNGVETSRELKEKAEEYLHDIQFDELCITCNAAELSFTNPQYERFKIGQNIRCISKPHFIDRLFPLTKLDLKLDEGSKTITLGSPKKMELTEIYKNAINEDIMNNIDLSGINDRIDGLDDKIDKLQFDLDNLDLDIDKIEEKDEDRDFELDKVTGTLDRMTKYDLDHWYGTQEEFDALEEPEEETIYLIIDPEPLYTFGENRTTSSSDDDEDVIPDPPDPG